MQSVSGEFYISKSDLTNLSNKLKKVSGTTDNLYHVLELIGLLQQAKAKEYGDSWRSRGLVSALINTERKNDRIRNEIDRLLSIGSVAYCNELSSQSKESLLDGLVDSAVYSLLTVTLIKEIAPNLFEEFVNGLVSYIGGKLENEV